MGRRSRAGTDGNSLCRRFRSKLKLVKREEGRGDQKTSGNGVIPAQMRTEIEGGEDAEDGERDDFLNHLELDGRKTAVADAVCGNLEAILKEGDTPADQNDLPKRLLTILQVAVPGDGHEDVGADEKNNGPHFFIRYPEVGRSCGRRVHGGNFFDEGAVTALQENLERLEEAIGAACRASGRQRSEVELMAVSKTFLAEAVAEAAALGLTLFGENRVQEFSSKVLHAAETGTWAVRGKLRFHLIGHLQSNKAAKAAELFDGVDSLDSVKLAERLNEAAGRVEKRLPVLIEVKLSPEVTKNGVEPESDEAAQLLERLPDLMDLEVRGLMTIAPWGAPDNVTRGCFRDLRVWRDRWAAAHSNLNLDVLSMGMSGDFALAIQEGATRIRIGTALFGARKSPAEPPSQESEIN
jgi:PLP dependent protein